MQIKRDSEIEKWVFNEIRSEWGKERDGIHLSDLLTPRQAYWRKKKPMPATDDEIMYWSSGKGHEGALLGAAGYDHAEAKQWNGIWYTPDMFQSMPIELKTRRRGLASDGNEQEEYEHYLKQLKGYCAVSGKNQGWLWVWCLVQKQDDYTTKPELACYRVEFTDEELNVEKARLSYIMINLNDTLNGLQPYTVLPQCPSWMCGRVKHDVIKKPYCVTCNKEFATPATIQKHINSKTGKGHEIISAEIETSFLKRCKWFDDCGPEI